MSVLDIVMYVIHPIAMCAKAVSLDGGEGSVKIDVLQTVWDLAVTVTVGSVHIARVGGVSIVNILVLSIVSVVTQRQENAIVVIQHFGGMTAVRNVTMLLVCVMKPLVSVEHADMEDGV